MKNSLLAGIFSCFAFFSFSQITTNTTVTATEMVDRIMGNGVTFSNATFTGDAVSRGYFDNGATTNLGMNSGIVLTSGRADIVPINNGGSQGNNNAGGAIPELNTIAGATTFDGAILEFDFVTVSNQINVRYIFGSDEYLEFVNSGYNDAFAFFISGPGIVGEQNIALVGGLPVTIDNINTTTNAGFFVNNTTSGNGATTIEYDGFTVTLNASRAVQPCQTYHIRLMIADGGDGIYDSGVFIEENGFFASGTTTTVDVNPGVGFNNAVEGCDLFSTFVVNIPAAVGTPTTFNYTFTGTATYGTDYEGVPLSVTIPAGQTSAPITFEIYDDGIAEPVESIVLNIETSPCVVEQFTLTITDPTPIVVDITNGSSCQTVPFDLTATASGGSGALTYSWDNGGGNGQTVSVTPNATTTYTLTVTDQCGDTGSGQSTLTIFDLPVVDAGTYGPACVDAADIALAGTPVGGTFSGTGVSGSNFDPNAGTQTITYTFTDGNNCTNSDQTTITVNNLPVVNAGSYGPVCIDAADIALAGTPVGGTFSGTGVTGTNFDPNAGTQTITYTFTDGNNCTNSAITSITVNNLPVVDAGSYGPVCIDAADIALAGTPVGGTFSGTGVAGTNFDPSVGTQTITYSFTDGNNCTNSGTTSITVNDLPVVDAGTYASTCIDGADVALAGTPVGGTFSGTGVTGTNFDPSVGTQTITYSFTDGNNCSNTDQATITVNNLLAVDAGTYAPVCIDAADVALVGTPAGGTFSGTGVTGNNFDPSVGTQTITYTFTDGNNCTNSGTATITVNNLPVVDAGSYGPVCIDAADIVLAGTPVGGTFTGTGVTGTNFDPNAGTQTLTYNFTDGNNCSNSATTSITVNDLPVVDAGSYGPVCIDAADIALAGTPVGGSFSGTGVTGNNFDPNAGTQSITYTFTDGNNCTNSANTSITVNNLPVVNAGSYGPVCIDAADIALAGTPVGGSFSGTGVTGTNFDPNAGTQSITYTFTDGNNCTNSATTSITVNNLPVVNAGTYGPVCIDAADIVLAGTPVGGTFTGTGVTGTNFDPNAGTQTLTYNFTDGNNCSNSATTSITVNDLPVVDAGSYGPVCIDAADIALAGTPVGGTFSGTGVTGTNFDPNAGTQTITYTFTDGNNCTNSDQTSITVNNLPVIDAGSYGPVCIDAADIALAGTPVGGTFSGTGVTGTNFDPNAGTQTITYTFTDGNNCTNSANTSITVNNLPVVSAGSYGPVCIDAADIALAGTPVGGTFSGTGVTGTNFDPNAGTQTLTYNFTDGNNCSNSATTSIIVNNLPVVDAGTYAATCIDGVDVALAGTPVGGSFTGTGVTGTNFDPSVGTQTITYTFTDGNNCSNTDQATITVNNLLAVDAGTYSPVCIDAADVALVGTPAGGTFSGTGVTGNNFDPSVGTQTITYTFTDGNNCTNSGTTTITVNALPSIGAGTDVTVCAGQSVTLNGSGGTTYSWDNGITNATSFVPTATTTYTVTGTDANGCQNTDQVLVTVNALPTVNAGNDATVCTGSQVTLTGTGTATTYTWNNGVTNNVAFTPATTTTYTVTGIDGNNCQNTDQVVITVVNTPTVNAGLDQTICAGQTITLSGTGTATTYTWNNGVTNGVAFAPTTTTTYTVTGVLGTCQATDQVTVTVNAVPTVTAGADQTICAGETVTLSGGGATTYTWTGGITNGTAFSPTTTTTYTVTGVGANGCTDTDDVTITVNALPTVNAGADLPICSGSSITLTATGTPATYTWTGGVTNGEAFTPSSTGTYTVTAVDANGCSSTDQVIVTVTQTPNASLSADETLGNPGLVVNFTNSSTNATSYDWNFGNGDQTTVNTTAGQTSTYDDLGVYNVELIAYNGICSDTATLIVTIEELPDVVIFIPNVTTITGDGINDGWWIGAQNAKSINVQIFNRWGNQMAEITEVYSPTNPNSYWDGTSNGNPVSDGTYFYKYVIVDLFDVEHTGHGHFTVIKN